jgi:phytoene synthase
METLSARLTRQSGSNFYYAFRLLPSAKRRAIYALYSFCRVVDDCVDEEGGEGAAGLARWSAEVRRCYEGRPETELGRDLAAALARFPIPPKCLDAIVEGCRMDLTTTRYRTFEELREYCLRVASAVGLASIEIFGYRCTATRDYAVELGLALQLTNILRDVSADAARGRLYVPLEDLERFGVSEAGFLADVRHLPRAPAGSSLAACLAFQELRTREHYARARALLPREDRRSMVPAEMMAAVYRGVLREVVRRGFPLLAPRARLSAPRKLGLALGAALRGLRP